MDKVDYSKSIQSVLVISIALYILSVINQTPIPIYFCIPIGFAGLLSSWIADRIHWVWMKFAWILSLIFPPIIMGIIFYFLLTPIASLSKFFSKKDTLQLKRTRQSTFISRVKAFEKVDFTKTW